MSGRYNIALTSSFLLCECCRVAEVSAFISTLPEGQRARALTAFAECGRLLNDALEDQARTAQALGSRAVAEAAYWPGGLMVEEIEAIYLNLVKRSRETTEPPTEDADPH